MRPVKYMLHVNTVVLLSAVTLLAGTYDVSWQTIDGGGVSGPGAGTSATFTLEGTIGQGDAGPAAGPMTSATFSILGGFWQYVPTCACPGDMNADGFKNGRDVQQFVRCLVEGGSCSCADLDGQNGPDLNDVGLFVADLLNPIPCN
jgi:hypothetical protein